MEPARNIYARTLQLEDISAGMYALSQGPRFFLEQISDQVSPEAAYYAADYIAETLEIERSKTDPVRQALRAKLKAAWEGYDELEQMPLAVRRKVEALEEEDWKQIYAFRTELLISWGMEEFAAVMNEQHSVYETVCFSGGKCLERLANNLRRAA